MLDRSSSCYYKEYSLSINELSAVFDESNKIEISFVDFHCVEYNDEETQSRE